MYRFKIYRNPNTPSIQGHFSDVVRYYFSLYNFERTITPIWNDLSFKWTRKERAFFRKELEGAMTLIGEDYQWAWGVRNDSSERRKYRAIVIEKQKDGVWEEEWRGFFSVSVATFDTGRCTATFEELLVWDKYTVILENIERERNLIDIPPHKVVYQKSPYDYDVEIVTQTTTFGLISGCSLPPDDFFEPQDSEIEYGLKYVLYSKRVDWIRPTADGHQYVKTFEYRRDFANQVASPGAEWVDGGDVAGTNGVKHWVRYYRNNNEPDFTTTLYRVYYAQYACYLRRSVSVSDAEEEDNYIENERGRFFGQAFLYSLQGLPHVETDFAKSLFLQAATNPVTGQPNRMNWLFLFQITDLNDTSDPATKAPYKFKDVEDWMKLLQLYWYIDDDGYLVIEHKKFFDQGLSYDPNTVGLDVSSGSLYGSQTKGKTKLSYLKDSIQRMDEIRMAYNSADDFVGEPIVYHGNMVNWGNGQPVTLSLNNLSTDLQYILNNEDSLGKDGFVLLATQPSTFYDGYLVYRGNGALTSELVWNAQLSVANIQNDYWRWGRPTNAGVMNGAYVEFDSTEYNLVQDDFRITHCDEFDPYSLVRTDFGNGKVLEAVKALKDDVLTLSLGYTE